MKVIITSNYEIGNETGASKVAELLVKYLNKNNQVVFISLGKKYGEYKVNKNLKRIEIPQVDLGLFQIPLITPIVLYKIFKFLDNFKPNIIHAQNAVFVSKLAQIWANINSVPFIITYHHIPTEAIYHLLPNFEKNILSNLVQEIYKETSLKNTLKNTDGVIAVNEAVLNSIKSVDNNIKVEIINNGIESKSLEKIKYKKLGSKQVNFVFLGSYNDRKNQIFLLKTFKYLPLDYKLSLYGNFKSGGEYLESLYKYKNDNSLQNITLNDFSNDITQIFKATDFLLSASKKEAQSLVVIQSMTAGKPIIGIENETISELVNKNNGMVVDKQIKPKQFAKKIEDFVKTSNYYELSKNIRNDSKKFDIEVVISKIEKFYKSICKAYSNNG
jgi:hypothetical protein